MHDLLLQSVFYIFAGLAVFSAFMVIIQNNPVRCVLFLVLTFIASAVLWMLLEAEFLSLILVLVYVGAVMTLFLFVVMMLNIDVESMGSHQYRYMPFGLVVMALLISLLLTALPKNQFEQPTLYSGTMTQLVAAPEHQAANQPKPMSNTTALGIVLYTDYVLAFELAAVILLVSIVAAITLVHRRPQHIRQQNTLKQLMTKRADRVELIQMKAEDMNQ